MLDQFKDMIVNNLVEKLNAKGINVDATTLKNAIANSPQIVLKVEEIYRSSLSTQEKLTQITALLKQAASGEYTSDSTETTKK